MSGTPLSPPPPLKRQGYTAQLRHAESMKGDPLLRRSFQAGGQPAHAQIGRRSGCPWVTAGERSFPPVLAQMWHGCRHSQRSSPLAVLLDTTMPVMLVATWILAASTAVLALTSFVAVVTWRESRRREREDQLAERTLDSARKEFAQKDSLDSRITLTWLVLGLAALIFWTNKSDGKS